MNIKLSDDYYIKHEGHCYTLYKLSVITGENTRGREAKPENIGKIKETAIGYYSQLEHALRKYVDYEAAAEDLQSVLAKLNAIHETIMTLPEKLPCN